MKDYFSDLYFKSPDFGEDGKFGLANRMYQYFKMLGQSTAYKNSYVSEFYFKLDMFTDEQVKKAYYNICRVDAGIQELKEEKGERFSIKQAESTKKNLLSRLESLQNDKTDQTVTFEQLGVDRLYVDEAHNYKNRARRCA